MVFWTRCVLIWSVCVCAVSTGCEDRTRARDCDHCARYASSCEETYAETTEDDGYPCIVDGSQCSPSVTSCQPSTSASFAGCTDGAIPSIGMGCPDWSGIDLHGKVIVHVDNNASLHDAYSVYSTSNGDGLEYDVLQANRWNDVALHRHIDERPELCRRFGSLAVEWSQNVPIRVARSRAREACSGLGLEARPDDRGDESAMVRYGFTIRGAQPSPPPPSPPARASLAPPSPPPQPTWTQPLSSLSWMIRHVFFSSDRSRS